MQEVAPRHIADEENDKNRDHEHGGGGEVLRRDEGKRNKGGDEHRKGDLSGGAVGFLRVGREGGDIKDEAELVEFGGLETESEDREPACTVVDVLPREIGDTEQDVGNDTADSCEVKQVAKVNVLHHEGGEAGQH